MRPLLFAIALTTLPSVLGRGGVWVINQCAWGVLMNSNGPDGKANDPRTIEAGDGYYEAYQGNGMAIKLSRYPKTTPMLVFGYSYVKGDPNVWYVINLLMDLVG